MTRQAMEEVIQNLWKHAEPVVQQEGCELVEVEYLREHGHWIVRLYIEQANTEIVEGIGIAPGQGVTLDQCAILNKQLSVIFDVEEIIPQAYNLEVSSPGLQRPLRKPEDFKRFTGFIIRLRSLESIAPVDSEQGVPSRNLKGTLLGFEDPHVHLQMNGTLFHIPWSQIAKAHLEPDREAWLSTPNKPTKKTGA